jgi:ATP-dependent Lhr-like helicase
LTFVFACCRPGEFGPGVEYHRRMTDHPPRPTTDPLDLFEPAVRDWFESTLGTPTPAQAAAWPLIARGEHVLVTAPTGSGKTLTAFLWALNAFAAGRSAPGHTRVLYLSPLKALNNDIQRNLYEPLMALQARDAVPPLRAETRSGDTSQGDRQRLLRHPPEILITTPESLMLLLSTARGRLALGGVETVIVDEVHALVDNRSGTLLFAALERLARLAGEFQRIALSATVRPLETVAAFVAGTDAAGRARPMAVVAPAHSKTIELDVRCPADATAVTERGIKIWDPLAAAFRAHIGRNQATLFFTNSRRLAERITFKINEGADRPLAWAHHGSLAREIRLAVEQRLKSGELKAIVATSSLEMGIDIGSLDEVVLIQAPPGIATTLQRIGRAGHGVGEISRGSLYPTHAQDFIDAAALTTAVAERDIEPVRLLENPLDVLAQLLIAFSASESWALDELYALLRQSGPYRSLAREHYDLVVEMLAGRYASTRIRELKPRLRVDRIRRRIVAERSAVLAFYHSGGVIPDRGYFQLRHADSGAAVGELDEEFVWEASTGQVFTMGTQNWQVQRITHNDVLARPTTRPATAPPFWRSERVGRSFHFSQRVGDFLERAERLLAVGDTAGLRQTLIDHHRFEPVAADTLIDYLARQRAATGTPLPHAHHLLAESVASGPAGYRTPGELRQLVLHTCWGGRVNRPLALAMRAAFRAGRAGIDATDVEIAASDNAIVLLSREPLEPTLVMGLVTPENLQTLLRATLESSGFFGARFREAAGRALLLSRQRFNARLPLWVSRLQARKLMTRVHALPDFPLLLECWRACLDDEFDLPALHSCLTGVAEGRIGVTRSATPTPSPFAGALAWDQINRYMYADDRPETAGPTSLSDELIATAIGNPALRPRLEPATVTAFLARRQRTAPGYAPESVDDWVDWVRERVLLPVGEAAGAESAGAAQPLSAHPDLCTLTLDDRRWLVHRELLQGLIASGLCAGATIDDRQRTAGRAPDLEDARSAEDFALEMLSFYGPLAGSAIATLLPRVPADLLQNSELLVSGALLAGPDDDTTWYCERQNYEALLRLQRSLARPSLQPRPCQVLPAFIARWQGFSEPSATTDPADAFEPLRGYRAPVAVWLDDLPAARGASLDQAFAELGLAWQGAGSGQIRIGDPADLALLDLPRAPPALSSLFRDPAARYGFTQLLDQQPAGLEAFNALWWREVWGGGLAADGVQPLREALTRDFRLTRTRTDAVPASSARRPQRTRAPRFRQGFAPGWSGHWHLVPAPESPEDPLVALEDARERARLLLDRYGLVCREIANREGDALRWGALFRAFRLMELAGEVTAGYFIEGLSGPQFLAPSALALLETATTTAGPGFWVNALDPVSPCGLGLDWDALPQRRPQNYLAFHAGQLALVAENQARRLRFMVPHDHPALSVILSPLAHLLRREHRLVLDSINDAPAMTSPFLPALAALGRIVHDHRQVWLESSRSERGAGADR